MPSPKQALARLANRLREAGEAQDWEAISVLDEQCRELVAGLGEDDAGDLELRDQLLELSILYDGLQQAGRAERARLAGELTRLNQSKQVSRAYKPLG